MYRQNAFLVITVLCPTLFVASTVAQDDSLEPSDSTSAVVQGVEHSPIVYGTTVPAKRTKLASRFNSVVQRIFYLPNERFAKGDVLIELDCSMERAQLEEARLSHQLEKQEYENLKKMSSKGIQGAEVQKLETKALSVELRLAHLNFLREKAKHCTITAPYAGRVADTFVLENEAVEAWKDLVEIIDDQAVEFHFFLPVPLAAKVSVGYPITVEVGAEKYPASISHIAIEADSIDNSYKAIAKMSEKKNIPLGVSGRADLNFTVGDHR